MCGSGVSVAFSEFSCLIICLTIFLYNCMIGPGSGEIDSLEFCTRDAIHMNFAGVVTKYA